MGTKVTNNRARTAAAIAAAATVLTVATLAGATARAQEIGVRVDGAPVTFAGQQPVQRGARVLVPLRGVFERMGATVHYEPDGRTVQVSGAGSDISLRVGSRQARVEGREIQLDAPARLRRGAVLVPLRFLAENLRADVDWNAAARMVSITTARGERENAAAGGTTTTDGYQVAQSGGAPPTTSQATPPTPIQPADRVVSPDSAVSNPPGPPDGSRPATSEANDPTAPAVGAVQQPAAPSPPAPMTAPAVNPSAETHGGDGAAMGENDWERWWPWILAVVAVLGVLAYLLSRRGSAGQVIAAKGGATGSRIDRDSDSQGRM